MPNEFDQFDPKPQLNEFDQFDSPKSDNTALDDALNFLPHQAGIISNAAIKGATALPTLAANIPGMVANTITGGYNALTGSNATKVPYVNPFGEGADFLLGNNAQPNTPGERLEGDILRPIFGVAAGSSAGQSLIEDPIQGITGGSLASALSSNPSIQYGGAAAGGLSGGVAREAGASPGWQIASSILGSLAGGAATDITQSTLASLSPQNIALKRLARDFARDNNITPGQAQSILENSPQEATLADIGDANIKDLSRSIVNTPGPGKTLAVNTLYGRQLGATDRMQDAVKAGFGTDAEFNDTLANLQAAKEQMAKPLYDKAFQSNQEMLSPAINKVLNTPAGQSALKSASIKMQNDMSLMGQSDPDLVEQAQLAGQYSGGGIAPALNLRSLDYVKRAFDDQIGNAVRSGENDNVRILSGLKNNLLKAIDSADTTIIKDSTGKIIQPGSYAQARQAWSGAASSQNALEMGRNFLSEDSQLTARTIADLDPSDQKFFQIGAARALADKVAANPNNTVKNILTNDLWKQRLQAAMPSNEHYFDFLKNAQDQANMMATKNAVLGNSTTISQAIKSGEDATSSNPLELNFGNIADAATGDWKGIAIQAAKKGLSGTVNRITNAPKINEQLAKMLFSSDPQQNSDTIQAWQKYLQGQQPSPFINRVINRAVPYETQLLYQGQQ